MHQVHCGQLFQASELGEGCQLRLHELLYGLQRPCQSPCSPGAALGIQDENELPEMCHAGAPCRHASLLQMLVRSCLALALSAFSLLPYLTIIFSLLPIYLPAFPA